jgi:hypothetical protein
MIRLVFEMQQDIENTYLEVTNYKLVELLINNLALSVGTNQKYGSQTI